jgi:hypothetical protein
VPPAAAPNMAQSGSCGGFSCPENISTYHTCLAFLPSTRLMRRLL